LSRDAAFLLNLRDAGVDFVAADMPDVNRMTVGIMAIIAEHERDAISKRMKEALVARKARGQPLGNPANLLAHHRVRGRLLGNAAIAERTTNRMADLEPVIRWHHRRRQNNAAADRHRIERTPHPGIRGGQWSAAQVRRVLERMAGA
jgi:DNA invertase Pin-like site-specific DNA recombinase